MKNLDAEEQEILKAFEAGTLKRTANAKAEIKRHRKSATATLKIIGGTPAMRGARTKPLQGI